MNYGELKTELLAIAHLSATDEVGARVAKFITRAEGMIASKVRAVEMIESDTMAEASRVSSGSGLYTAPARCLDVLQVTNGSSRVERRSALEIQRFNTAGPTAHSFAVYGGDTAGGLRLELRAIPAFDSSFTVVGFFRPTAMALDTDEGALLTSRESLYIHGALHWLYLDAHDSELAAAHKAGFDNDVLDVNAAAKTALRAVSVNALDYNVFSGSAM